MASPAHYDKATAPVSCKMGRKQSSIYMLILRFLPVLTFPEDVLW